MIMIYESERLCQQIRDKNHASPLNINTHSLFFDLPSQKIAVSKTGIVSYTGRQVQIDILPRLVEKYNNSRAFEAHLQSFVVKNIGTGNNTTLDVTILGQDSVIEWIGNEVSCGVGMQRIDVAISAKINGILTFMPIELKAVEASTDIVRQVGRYVDWIEQYYKPNRQSDIAPIVIAKEFAYKKTQAYLEVIRAFKNYNLANSARCRPIRYVEYVVIANDIRFKEVVY